MRNEEERREYNRLAQQRSRQKKASNAKSMTVNDMSALSAHSVVSSQITEAKKNVRTESPEPLRDSTPPVLAFPVVGRPDAPTWGLSSGQIGAWRATYPALDVEAECRKAQAWILAAPSRRKTARGMPRFLVGWLNRATDRGGGRLVSGQPSPAVAAEKPDMHGHIPPCATWTACTARAVAEGRAPKREAE